MGLISFDQSGSGAVAIGQLTLAEVQELCCDCGFAKPGVAPSKPLALRADMPAFFKALGVTSLTAFRELFYNSRVPQPKPGQAPPPPPPKKQVAAAPAESAGPKNYAVPDVKEYNTLAASFEELKWRIIPRPGGATMKPDDYYILHGAKNQAEQGDNSGDKPMWASTGGLDFDGRERWEAWNKHQGMSKAEAQKAFCDAYGRAQSRQEENFRKY